MMTKIEPPSTVAISTTDINNDYEETTTTRRTKVVVVSPTNDKECDEQQQRQHQERPPVVEEPKSITDINDMDILAGRGGKTNNHQGNRMFRRLVNENKPMYQNTCTKQSQKYYLAVSIVVAMERVGGRFLRQTKNDPDEWMIIPRRQAIAKTCQALRELQQSHHQQQQPTLLSSSATIGSRQRSHSKQAIAIAGAAAAIPSSTTVRAFEV